MRRAEVHGVSSAASVVPEPAPLHVDSARSLLGGGAWSAMPLFQCTTCTRMGQSCSFCAILSRTSLPTRAASFASSALLPLWQSGRASPTPIHKNYVARTQLVKSKMLRLLPPPFLLSQLLKIGEADEEDFFFHGPQVTNCHGR